MKNCLYKKYLLAFIFMVLLFYNIIFIFGETSYEIDKEGNLKKIENNKLSNTVSEETYAVLTYLSLYSKEHFSSQLEKGELQLVIKDNGDIVLEDISYKGLTNKLNSLDNSVIIIPNSIAFKKENGNWIIEGKSPVKYSDKNPGGYGQIIKFENIQVVLNTYSKLIYTEKGKERSIKLTGDGDISIDGKLFPGISNAEIKLDDKNEVIYANFVSVRGGDYEISYQGKTFLFRAGKNGHILFDPLNKNINGDNLEYLKLDGNSIFGAKKFTATLDENNNIKSIEIENGKFISSRGEIFSSKEKFSVFIGKDFDKNFNGKAVFLNNDKVGLKGEIYAEKLKNNNGGSFYYEGEANSIVEFDRKKSDFNVISGDCKFNNNHYEVKIQNGESFLKLINKQIEFAPSFSFSKNQGEKEIIGYIDESIGKYKISIKQEGQEEFTGSVSLSLLKSSYKASTGLLGEANQVEFLNKDLLKKQEELDSVTDPVKKLGLELSVLKTQNAIDVVLNNGFEDSLKRIEDYKKKITESSLDDETKNNLINEADIARIEIEINQNKLSESRKIYTVNNQKYVGGGFSGMGNAQFLDQYLDLEVNKNGKVTAFIFEGKRYELNGKNTEIPLGLSDGNYPLVQALKEDNSFENLQKNNPFMQGLKFSGISKSGPDFLDRQNAMEATLLRINDLEDYYNGNPAQNKEKLQQLLKLRADTYLAGEERESALEEYKKITENQEISPEMSAQAYLSIARINGDSSFDAISAIRNGKEVIHAYGEAAKLDPALVETYNLETRKYLEFIKRLYSDESKISREEITRLQGKGDWGNGQYFVDSLGIIAQPWTYGYIFYNGRFVSMQNANLDLSIFGQNAVQTTEILMESNINLREYAEASQFEKIQLVYETLGYSKTIPFDFVQESMSKLGIDLDNKETFTPSRIEELGNIIGKNYGSGAELDFQNYFLTVFNRVNILNDRISNDPNFYTLFSMGTPLNEIAYTMNSEGKKSLNQAFNYNRVGAEIKLSDTEMTLLTGADVLLNPMSFIGVSEAVSAGKLATAKFASILLAQTALQEGAQYSEVVAGVQVGFALKDIATALANGLRLTYAGAKTLGFFRNAEGEALNVIRATEKGVSQTAESLITQGYKEVTNAEKLAKYEKITGAKVLQDPEGNIHLIVPEGQKLPKGFKEIVPEQKIGQNSAEIAGAESEQAANSAKKAEDAVNEAKSANAPEIVPETATSGCFLAGTRILLSDGSYRNIENMKEGDKVVAFDLINNKVVDADITTTFVRKANGYRIIEYEIV